ncbi:MAG: hypothetical protein RLZZ24_981 [Pseudomonadota bacterium]
MKPRPTSRANGVNASRSAVQKQAGVESHRGPGEIRIIGGQWRRTRLTVPVREGLRPTPDRVRETLFNWIGPAVEGARCVDVFAGTGALGLEAASRGAAHVVLCEQDRGLVQQLQQQVIRLQAQAVVQVVAGDGLQWIKQAISTNPGAPFDWVFLDPPFEAQLFEVALQAAAQAISANGMVYLESPMPWQASQLAPMGLTLHRHLKAGAVHAHLIKRADATKIA